MTLDQLRFHPIYRAIQLARRHSRDCRGVETRELLLAVERSLLKAAALEGLCEGADACSMTVICRGMPAGYRCACAARHLPF